MTVAQVVDKALVEFKQALVEGLDRYNELQGNINAIPEAEQTLFSDEQLREMGITPLTDVAWEDSNARLRIILNYKRSEE